jgi:multicomponent Na+:H+ antiporter subunit C
MINVFLIKIVFLLFFLSIIFTILTESIIKKVLFLGFTQSFLILIYFLINYPIKLNKTIVDNFVLDNANAMYVDPLPQALMLTAIVVGFVMNAISVALILRIKRVSGRI